MNGWRKKIDQKLQLEKEEAERQQALAEEQRKKQEQAAYNKRLQQYRTQFQCHICHKTCDPESTFHEAQSLGWSVEDGYVHDDAYTVIHWDTPPKGFELCSICHTWNCPDHIHRGICVNHAV